MALTPSYVATPRMGAMQLTAANTARDGSGTIVNVFTGGASGSRIDAIFLKATGTTTAGMIRLFVSDGTNSRLIAELPVSPNTVAATNPSWQAQLTSNSLATVLPLILPNGYSLRASTEKAETFNIVASGGDF